MDELKAKKILKEVRDVLNEENVEFWLNFGCLLGAVRDGKFISYDNDIEINAWKHKVTEQQMRNVSRKLCQRGFNVYYSTLTDYISIRKNNIPIGFSTYRLDGNNAVRPHEPVEEHGFNTSIARFFYNVSEVFARNRVGKINTETILGMRRLLIFLAVAVTSLVPNKLRRKFAILFRIISMKIKKGYGQTSIPARFYLELRDLTFYGEMFKVPQNTEEYLEFVYGPDWRTPMRNWNFHDPDKKSITSIKFLNKIWDYK